MAIQQEEKQHIELLRKYKIQQDIKNDNKYRRMIKKILRYKHIIREYVIMGIVIDKGLYDLNLLR